MCEKNRPRALQNRGQVQQLQLHLAAAAGGPRHTEGSESGLYCV